MKPHLLAVYGTLKKGYSNARLLRDSKLLGEQYISGFKMFSCGGFPAINKSNDDDKIKIEVYEVTDESVLNNIYRLEGYSGTRDASGNWYDTTDVNTDYGTAEIFYFKTPMDNSSRPVVETGVW